MFRNNKLNAYLILQIPIIPKYHIMCKPKIINPMKGIFNSNRRKILIYSFPWGFNWNIMCVCGSASAKVTHKYFIILICFTNGS